MVWFLLLGRCVFVWTLDRTKGGGSKVIYEYSGPKYKSNSGDVKMIWLIFTREM